MSVRLTAMTIPCLSYGAIAYPLTCMFHTMSYTCLSFSAPSIKQPSNGRWRMPIFGWQCPTTLKTTPSARGGLFVSAPPPSQSRSQMIYLR